MKQETKDLLLWVSEALNSYSFGKKDLVKQKCKKALNFLNSLPEIESKLSHGGYIQDKNGTPCCDGDKILFCGEYNGFLRFGFIDESEKKYNPIPHFWFDFGGEIPTASNPVYFEKVE